jgi:hypothetical protein
LRLLCEFTYSRPTGPILPVRGALMPYLPRCCISRRRHGRGRRERQGGFLCFLGTLVSRYVHFERMFPDFAVLGYQVPEAFKGQSTHANRPEQYNTPQSRDMPYTKSYTLSWCMVGAQTPLRSGIAAIMYRAARIRLPSLGRQRTHWGLRENFWLSSNHSASTFYEYCAVAMVMS